MVQQRKNWLQCRVPKVLKWLEWSNCGHSFVNIWKSRDLYAFCLQHKFMFFIPWLSIQWLILSSISLLSSDTYVMFVTDLEPSDYSHILAVMTVKTHLILLYSNRRNKTMWQWRMHAICNVQVVSMYLWVHISCVESASRECTLACVECIKGVHPSMCRVHKRSPPLYVKSALRRVHIPCIGYISVYNQTCLYRPHTGWVGFVDRWSLKTS